MRQPIISLSLLEYEPDLPKHEDDVARILASGVEWLHVDIMDYPFIRSGPKFPMPKLSLLYRAFRGKAMFDFHVMSNDPLAWALGIQNIVNSSRQDCFVTIHREAFRNYAPLSEGGLGVYAGKEYDLSTLKIGDYRLNAKFSAAHVESGSSVLSALKFIRKAGFNSGIALEPGTSIDTLTNEMIQSADMVLLMGVQSGMGGQKYDEVHVTPKTEAMRKRYPSLMIQVDGGVNDETIAGIARAGADNLVVGSYITNSRDPAARIAHLRKIIGM